MAPIAFLLLVAGGVSDYSIVTPDQPIQSVSYAAEKLQAHLRRSTGALQRVVVAPAPTARRIFVGPRAATAAAGITTPRWEHFVPRAALERAYTRTNDPAILVRLDFVRIGLQCTDAAAHLVGVLKKLNGAGMAFSHLNPELTVPAPDRNQVMDWVIRAKSLHERAWQTIDSQGRLPALHRPALEFFEQSARWGETIEGVHSVSATVFVHRPGTWWFDDLRLGQLGTGGEN